MEACADDAAQDSGTAPSDTLVNGSIRRTPSGGPTTSDGARYLEALRARRRAEPSGGLRIFNPDETPVEREERIREQLAGLAALAERSDEESNESPELWDQVMETVERPRLEFHEIILNDVDS